MIVIRIAFAVASLGSSDLQRYASTDELLLEKRGSVVEASTDHSIADASVIVVWKQEGYGWTGDRGGCRLEKIVKTDPHGAFSVPNVTNELDISGRRPPSAHPEALADSSWLDFKWGIIVYAPGYVRDGDLEEFEKGALSSDSQPIPGTHYRSAPAPLINFHWLAGSPAVEKIDTRVRLKPLRMVKANLNPLQQIVYYDRILRYIGNCFGAEKESPEQAALSADIAARIADAPCRLPPDSVIGHDVVSDYAFITNSRVTLKRLQDAGNIDTQGVFHDMAARDLCRAATSEAEYP